MCLFSEMAQWVNETFQHFVKETSQLTECTVKLFNKLNMEESFTGPLQLSWTEENDEFNLSQIDTHSTKFFAYTGYRYVKENNINHVYICIVVIDIKTKSYIAIQSLNTRMAKRYLRRMYDGLKIRVINMIYDHMCMNNFDFSEDF